MCVLANAAKHFCSQSRERLGIRHKNNDECPRSGDLGYVDFAKPKSFTALPIGVKS